jgi:hypothetical protein
MLFITCYEIQLQFWKLSDEMERCWDEALEVAVAIFIKETFNEI